MAEFMDWVQLIRAQGHSVQKALPKSLLEPNHCGAFWRPERSTRHSAAKTLGEVDEAAKPRPPGLLCIRALKRAVLL